MPNQNPKGTHLPDSSKRKPAPDFWRWEHFAEANRSGQIDASTFNDLLIEEPALQAFMSGAMALQQLGKSDDPIFIYSNGQIYSNTTYGRHRFPVHLHDDYLSDVNLWIDAAFKSGDTPMYWGLCRGVGDLIMARHKLRTR